MSRARVTADANVRSAPTKGDNVIGVARAGETVEAGAGAPWRPVTTAAGLRGWMHASLLLDMAPPVPTKPAARPKWRVAKSLEKLLAQINARAPKRNKIHDGSIGDSAHAARASDHNPNKDRVVTARDFTHDPKNGCDCAALAETLRLYGDKRIKYVIWARRMFSSIDTPKGKAWQWRPYTGANPHDKHLHLSVSADPALYDDERAWAL